MVNMWHLFHCFPFTPMEKYILCMHAKSRCNVRVPLNTALGSYYQPIDFAIKMIIGSLLWMLEIR